VIGRRLDRFQQRHTWAGFPLAVVYKYIDDQGYYLSALLAYYGLVSLFPLLLLLVTVLGFALQNDAGLRQQVLHSALVDFPVLGQQIAANIHTLHGSVAGVVVGAVGAVVGALSVAGAGQTVMNRIWAVPRVKRPSLVGYYLRSLLFLGTIGFGVVLTTGLTGLTTAVRDLGGGISVTARALATVLAVVVNILLFLLAFRVLTARHVGMRQLAVGAVTAGLLWQALQEIGTFLVGHELRGAGQTYGLFGVVIGLVAWLYLAGTIVVVCAEINAVRSLELWPRSLAAPVTGTGPLTTADRQAYSAYAETEKHVKPQRIDVDFDRDPADNDSDKQRGTAKGPMR
jgi:YihY family inner membrane protein